MPKSLNLLLATAVGIIAANLYYAQPLVALIAKSLELDPSKAGLVVTLTQIGYCLGVLFIVPLGDLIENRRLILGMILIATVSILGLGFATQLIPYFVAAFSVGLGVSVVQIIVPYAAHMTTPENSGRIVGSLMSGLMMGIMLSRPIASLLTDLVSWHAVFYLSASIMTILAFALYKALPIRRPQHDGLKYSTLLASMGSLVLHTPVLRRRAIYQACMFGAFCLFWTASPLLLSGPEFHLTQTEIAIFAFAGIAGAIAAPFAGKYGDRGYSRSVTAIAMISGIVSFLMTHIFAPGSAGALVFLVISAILLDAGVTANLVTGQRAIFSLEARYRSRLNGLYLAIIFVGGSLGSFIGAWAFAHGGWQLTSWMGILFPSTALLYFATEWITGFQKK
ncbi:MAG: MFS transporter [Bacillota bacterium]